MDASRKLRDFIMKGIIIDLDDPYLRIKKLITLLILSALLAGLLGFGILSIHKVLANNYKLNVSELPAIQENSLLAISSPENPQKVVQKIKVVATGYSSTVEQTDSTPFITASGSTVRDGIIANNLLPFGTEVRIPELYGDKVFIVEDRMHSRKGKYHVDIWFPEYFQAKEFGAKTIYIEVLSS